MIHFHGFAASEMAKSQKSLHPFADSRAAVQLVGSFPVDTISVSPFQLRSNIENYDWDTNNTDHAVDALKAGTIPPVSVNHEARQANSFETHIGNNDNRIQIFSFSPMKYN